MDEPIQCAAHTRTALSGIDRPHSGHGLHKGKARAQRCPTNGATMQQQLCGACAKDLLFNTGEHDAPSVHRDTGK